MAQWNLLYDLYERRVRSEIAHGSIPRHVGVILDGNRRWARSIGTTASHGHRAGAGKIAEFLEWAEEVGVEIVTLWMLSTDNLERDQHEIDELFDIIGQAVRALAAQRRWKIGVVGDLSLLSEDLADELRSAQDATKDMDGLSVNIAVGYGGRHEIADAVRSLLRDAAAQGRTLEEVADSLTDEDITNHL